MTNTGSGEGAYEETIRLVILGPLVHPHMTSQDELQRVLFGGTLYIGDTQCKYPSFMRYRYYSKASKLYTGENKNI